MSYLGTWRCSLANTFYLRSLPRDRWARWRRKLRRTCESCPGPWRCPKRWCSHWSSPKLRRCHSWDNFPNSQVQSLGWFLRCRFLYSFIPVLPHKEARKWDQVGAFRLKNWEKKKPLANYSYSNKMIHHEPPEASVFLEWIFFSHPSYLSHFASLRFKTV